ncbi:MAG: hypothetical protein QOG62_2431 [Thermoleophilaceae bacterium]|nr:hypothetical protein [Thermoleophilaceae bacterium]
MGEAIAAACGVLLLLAMIALPWFSATVQPVATTSTDVATGATNIVGAFNAYTVIDYILLACIVLLVVVPLLGGGRAGAGVVTAAALLAFGLILYSIISPPGHGATGYTVIVTAQVGVYIGVAFSALAVIGGLVAIGQAGAAGQAPTATHDAL